MEKLTKDNWEQLKHGDVVYIINDLNISYSRSYFIGSTPKANYLVFARGSMSTSLHINELKYHSIYFGEYNNEIIGAILLAKTKELVDTIQKNYFNNHKTK